MLDEGSGSCNGVDGDVFEVLFFEVDHKVINSLVDISVFVKATSMKHRVVCFFHPLVISFKEGNKLGSFFPKNIRELRFDERRDSFLKELAILRKSISVRSYCGLGQLILLFQN